MQTRDRFALEQCISGERHADRADRSIPSEDRGVTALRGFLVRSRARESRLEKGCAGAARPRERGRSPSSCRAAGIERCRGSRLKSASRGGTRSRETRGSSFSLQAGASGRRHSTGDRQQGAAPPLTHWGILAHRERSTAAPRHRRIGNRQFLMRTLTLRPERNGCTTDRRERYGGVVTLQQTMNHSATRAHAPRASSLRDIFCFFMARCSSEASSRLIASAVASSAGPSFFSVSSVSRSARRAGILPSHMYFGLCRVRVRQPVNLKAGRLLAHQMLRAHSVS